MTSLNPRSIAEPSACQHCGIPRRVHYQQWNPLVGWHQWQPPTDEQIKARMTARRAARLAPPETTANPDALITITVDDGPFRDAILKALAT